MSAAFLSILSLLPIITVAMFLVVLRWPASRAMPLSYAVAFVMAYFVWEVSFLQVAAASVNGLILARQASVHHFRCHPLAEHAAGERRAEDHPGRLHRYLA